MTALIVAYILKPKTVILPFLVGFSNITFKEA